MLGRATIGAVLHTAGQLKAQTAVRDSVTSRRLESRAQPSQ